MRWSGAWGWGESLRAIVRRSHCCDGTDPAPTASACRRVASSRLLTGDDAVMLLMQSSYRQLGTLFLGLWGDKGVAMTGVGGAWITAKSAGIAAHCFRACLDPDASEQQGRARVMAEANAGRWLRGRRSGRGGVAAESRGETSRGRCGDGCARPRGCEPRRRDGWSG